MKLSQDEITEQDLVVLGVEGQILQRISSWETDDREPPLYVLLKYARLAGVCLDVLIDDDLDLPTRLPSTPSHSPKKK